MTLAWIRTRYAVPAVRGARVEFTGRGGSKFGTIVGTSGPHLRIRLDGVRHATPFHPTWELRYIAEFTDDERTALALLNGGSSTATHWIAKACGWSGIGATARARRLLLRLQNRGLAQGEGLEYGGLIRWWSITDAGRKALCDAGSS